MVWVGKRLDPLFATAGFNVRGIFLGLLRTLIMPPVLLVSQDGRTRKFGQTLVKRGKPLWMT